MPKRERTRSKVDYTKGGNPVAHGLASSYNNHKCGCDECTEAWRVYMAPRVKAYRQNKKHPPPPRVNIRF